MLLRLSWAIRKLPSFWRSSGEVIFLVEIGANKDEPTTDAGDTALHLAAIGGHLDMVRLLVESGTDSGLTAHDGRSGRSASILACEQGHDEIVRSLAELR